VVGLAISGLLAPVLCSPDVIRHIFESLGEVRKNPISIWNGWNVRLRNVKLNLVISSPIKLNQYLMTFMIGRHKFGEVVVSVIGPVVTRFIEITVINKCGELRANEPNQALTP